MYIKYKRYMSENKFCYEIGEFKALWYDEETDALVIIIKSMADIYLPMPLDYANAFSDKFFTKMHGSNFIEISGLCLDEQFIDDFTSKSKGGKFNKDSFLTFVADMKSNAGENYACT